MAQVNSNEAWFGPLFRLAGYGLLALSVLDIIDSFVPLRFTNPAWELQLVSGLVERVPVPLLGLVLVLVGENSSRVFRFLSWACLVVSILFFLLFPLTISSAWRIEQQNRQQVNQQVEQQAAQLQQVRNLLSKANTEQQINQVLARINPQGRLPANSNPQEVKSRLLAQIAQGEKQLKQQAQTNLGGRSTALIKNAVKLALGALISGIIFLVIWRKTSRVLRANRAKTT